MKLEKKYISFKVQKDNITEQGIVYGYASTNDIDLDNDIIMPGAFQESINNFSQNPNSIKALWQHNTNDIIGKITELYYEENKLKISMQLYIDGYDGEEDGLENANKAFYLAKRGDLSFSVGFYNAKSNYQTINDKECRVIEKANLYEVSLVSFPANQKAIVTNVKNKNVQDFIMNIQEKDILDHIKEVKNMEDFNLFCEDVIKMPRNIRKAFNKFIISQIDIKKEFHEDCDTSDSMPGVANEALDIKSTEILTKCLNLINNI